MPAPKVSIIVPVYNTESYLAECLDSALTQILDDLELICVNDGSTDGSVEILADYAARDARVRVLTQKNKGQSAARNKALVEARGEYVLFLDSDDCLAPEALDTLYKQAFAENLDDLFFTASSFFESEELEEQHASYQTYYNRKGSYPDVVSGPELFVQMNSQGDFRPAPVLQFLKRDFLVNAGITFYEGIIHEDNLFTLQCYALAERARYLDVVLYKRRVRANSTMTETFNFKHAYGYFVCAREIQTFAIAHNLQSNEPYWHQLTDRIRVLYNLAASALDGVEREYILKETYALTPEECSDFLGLVYDRHMAQQQAKRVRKLRATNEELRTANKELRAANKRLTARNRKLAAKNKKYRSSTSWKIGRAITWLPRKIKKVFR